MTQSLTHDDHAQNLTLPFQALSRKDLATVGGKGANLGAMTQAGIPVPPGFCVTTLAYDQFVAQLPDATHLFAALDALDGKDVEAARRAAEQMRTALATQPLPQNVARAVTQAWQTLGVHFPLAVRSSATAEDLPGASFAGQQDTYLNILGEEALHDAVKRCWISLFTDRAVLYRARSGFGHESVKLSVVVQRLVEPDVSGILFTADPISGHRKITSIDAGFGLGEALVGGLISADLYRVDRRTRTVIEATVGDKAIAIRSLPGGGTRQEKLSQSMRSARSLTDAQVLALADMGERIETYYGGEPQDVEWCFCGEELFIVQSRPITSLFPVPQPSPTHDGLHVYVSFGHLQMMTEAIPRLAREVWGLLIPAGKQGKVSNEDTPSLSPALVSAANRVFVDVTLVMRTPHMRNVLMGVMGHIYEEAARTVMAITQRDEFKRREESVVEMVNAFRQVLAPVLKQVPGVILRVEPVAKAKEIDATLTRVAAEVRARITAPTGLADRLRRVRQELNGLFMGMIRHAPMIFISLASHRVLARLARNAWAAEHGDDIDRLLRGLPGNVTTEMDLQVGDLTDLVRPYPALGELLKTSTWTEMRAQAPSLPGGQAFLQGLDAFLEQFGMRGAGEIDVSRPRWRDNPQLLLKVITGGLSAGSVGEHRARHAAQMAEGDAAAARLNAAATRGLWGFVRGPVVKRLTALIRNGMGLREHPKFTMIRVLGAVRQEVQAAAALLVSRQQLEQADDVWHLGFEEVIRLVDNPTEQLRVEARGRREAFVQDLHRKPPLVISSDGETPVLKIEIKDMPAGALPGTAASKGVVEGLARVVHNPETETLHAGEILVAPFTDPGWTPLFVHAAAVVTEVGGLMTHGAVVAREYGIPAVVSVKGATESIKTGQRIRVDGTRGFIEILSQP